MAGRLALVVLLQADRFPDIAIEMRGHTPFEVEAMRVLQREPHADAAFKALLANAWTPGRLYALCGLWFTDRTAFDEAVGFFGDEEVEYQAGCLVVRAPAWMFVRKPESEEEETLAAEHVDWIPFLPDGELPRRIRDGP